MTLGGRSRNYFAYLIINMSWNPFKKAFSGRRTRSEDLEFEREINKLKQMQAVSKRMYKDMKRCNEIETGHLRCKQSLINNIKSFSIARVEPLKLMAEVLGGVAQSLHVHTKDLKAIQDSVFVDPIKRLNTVYKQVELHAKQREQRLQEYERQQMKLEKQGRKTTGLSQHQSGSQSRLDISQRAVTTARADYERVHDRLMLEIPQLLEGRVDYFDVCLFAVMNAQSLYYTGCSSSILTGLIGIQEGGSRGASPIQSEERIQQTTSADLTAIRMLSIVGSHNLIMS